MYISAADRVRMYELRTAGTSSPALPVVLGLRCDNILWGTTASQVKVLYGQGAQRGSMICFYGAYLRALAFFSCENVSDMRVELSSRAASVTLRK